MIQREESRHDFAFLAGVVIGAIAGAAATLVLAPRTGADTREKVRSRVREINVDEVKDRARSATSTVRDAASRSPERLRDLAANAPAAGQVLGATKNRVTDLVDKSPLPVQIGSADLDDARQAAERPRTVEDAEPFDLAAEGDPSTAAEKAEQIGRDAADIPDASPDSMKQAAADAVAEAKPDDERDADEREATVPASEPFATAKNDADSDAQSKPDSTS